jgi:chromosome segregation ATPase
MTIDELRTEMATGFATIDKRFESNDARLNSMNARFDAMDARFDAMDARFQRVDEEFVKVRAQIKAEGETTRRHFEIMVEKITDSVKIVAEAAAHHTARLDDHETRLQRLEPPGRQR